MELISNFAVETLAGLIGVFTGVILALWTERRREARKEEGERASVQSALAELRRLLLSSVVKNTSEAKRLRTLLGTNDDPYLFQLSFELADWHATQDQFVRIAGLDERLLLTRFFGQVERIMGLIEFHRRVRAEVEVRPGGSDVGDRALLSDSLNRLRVVADELRIDGLVVVTDLGEPIHKRMLGMKEVTEPASAA